MGEGKAISGAVGCNKMTTSFHSQVNWVLLRIQMASKWPFLGGQQRIGRIAEVFNSCQCQYWQASAPLRDAEVVRSRLSVNYNMLGLSAPIPSELPANDGELSDHNLTVLMSAEIEISIKYQYRSKPISVVHLAEWLIFLFISCWLNQQAKTIPVPKPGHVTERIGPLTRLAVARLQECIMRQVSAHVTYCRSTHIHFTSPSPIFNCLGKNLEFALLLLIQMQMRVQNSRLSCEFSHHLLALIEIFDLDVITVSFIFNCSSVFDGCDHLADATDWTKSGCSTWLYEFKQIQPACLSTWKQYNFLTLSSPLD
jgi:hypothetical protein